MVQKIHRSRYKPLANPVEDVMVVGEVIRLDNPISDYDYDYDMVEGCMSLNCHLEDLGYEEFHGMLDAMFCLPEGYSVVPILIQKFRTIKPVAEKDNQVKIEIPRNLLG